MEESDHGQGNALRQLKAAIEAYVEGGKLPLLPLEEAGDLGSLAASCQRLIDREIERKREIEDSLGRRILELEIRSSLARALATMDEDERAYGAVIEALVDQLKAAGGLIAYRDGKDELLALFAGDARVRKLGPEDAKSLAEASATSGAQRPFSGLEFPFPLAMGIGDGDNRAGYIVLGRIDRPFDESDLVFAGHIIDELLPPFLQRRNRAMQERIRHEAERALRRSEERLRAFFEESPDMIYTANAVDVIASINGAGLKLLGLADRFSAVGRPFSDFVLSREDRSFLLKKISEEGFISNYEIVMRRADGSTVFCVETSQAVKDRNGRLIEVQGNVRDISARINSERELWKTNMELAQAIGNLKDTQMLMVQQEKLASIGQLAAGVAHEINNPLGFLKSNQAMFRRYITRIHEAWMEAEKIDPAAHAAITGRFDLGFIFEEIETAAAESDEGFRRIIEIVSNLRNFSRIDSEAAFGAYDLNKGIESTLIVARNEIKYVAEVELNLGEVPLFEAMGNQINQVIMNLTVNSAQAIGGMKREGLGRIQIRTGVAGDNAIFMISDDGPGIPEDLRLRIFDPFFTTKEPGKGTGLGLSISYDIVVNKHRGILAVEASHLGGAAFRMELPLRRKAAGVDGRKDVAD
jgi:PAS domain S-box-containing protein